MISITIELSIFDQVLQNEVISAYIQNGRHKCLIIDSMAYVNWKHHIYLVDVEPDLFGIILALNLFV